VSDRRIRRLERSAAGFPPLLRAIHDPPRGLFLRGGGGEDVLSWPAAAVVGARACSSYGGQVARMLGRELAAAGVLVVSGLARGIDGEAHRGALEAGGVTVGVLGCGIDRIYPAAHAQLAEGMSERGLVISEYEPGIEAAPWRFPARNRIIAGLCQATVIVEARERSGALITADFALEEGREVFVVPGEITSALSAGTNRLLKVGAAPLTDPRDVLEVLGVEPPGPPPQPELGEAAAAVLVRLRDGAASADELARRTALDPGPLAAALAELELSGVVAEAEGLYREVRPPE
jgi:DNA processing protein